MIAKRFRFIGDETENYRPGKVYSIIRVQGAGEISIEQPGGKGHMDYDTIKKFELDWEPTDIPEDI